VTKYRLLLSVAFQDALQYRAEGVIWFLFDLLPPFMMLFVWLAAYRETEQVGGYTVGAMLGYYLGLALLRGVLTSHPEWEVAESIRDGKLAMLLLKPLDPWGYWLVCELPWRLTRLGMMSPILLGAVLLLGGQVRLPAASLGNGLALALSLPLAFLLCFFVKLCVGFAAFWLLEIQALSGLFEVCLFLFGGTIVPLELLPDSLRGLAALLPFEYVYAFPLALALGRVGPDEIWNGLAVQALWTAGLFALARLLWWGGLRRFEAVGG
jgi:viologen exporter family transport system permease protein